jgi:hypothetical protein
MGKGRVKLIAIGKQRFGAKAIHNIFFWVGWGGGGVTVHGTLGEQSTREE